MFDLAGIKVIESAAATEQGGRVKVYPKRKAKSEAHWRRMDKKWRKRYGYARKPCMYMMNTAATLFGSRGDRVLVVHPSLMPQLRATIQTASK
jgi:hypothetical protein